MTRRRYDRYDAEAHAELAQPSVVDLDVRVPCGLAIRLGVGFGLLVALLWAALMPKENVAWWVVLVRPGIIGAAVGVAVYLLLFGLWARDERRDRKQQRAPQTTTRLEMEASPLERPIVPILLDIVRGGQHRYLAIDITSELQVFARRVLLWRENEKAPLGLSFAEAPAQSVEFDGFLALRDEMMARGLLRWKNPEHHLSGYVFRAGFDEALRYVAAYEMEG